MTKENRISSSLKIPSMTMHHRSMPYKYHFGLFVARYTNYLPPVLIANMEDFEKNLVNTVTPNSIAAIVIEPIQEAAQIVQGYIKNGVFIATAGINKNFLRMLISLEITDGQVNETLDLLEETVAKV